MASVADWVGKREAKWRRVVRGHGASGLSVRADRARQKVREPAFYWWRAELARRDAAKPAAAFVPVMVRAAAAADRIDGVMIELRGGRVLQLPAMPVSQVVELVRAIEGDAVTTARGAA